jgi:hypothetical protein
MTNFKGTKGKWRIETDKDSIFGGNDDYQQITAGQGFYDQHGNSELGFCFSGYISKANTLLISKAPEMLEMLEDLVKTWDFVNDKKYHNHDMEKARQLIKETTEL